MWRRRRAKRPWQEGRTEAYLILDRVQRLLRRRSLSRADLERTLGAAGSLNNVFATIPHGVLEVLAIDPLEGSEYRFLGSYGQVEIALDLKLESGVHITSRMD